MADDSRNETGLDAILASIRATISGDGAPASPARPAASPRAAARPVPRGPSVEEFLARLVEPHVAEWLDAHLPEIVQSAVQREVERLMGPASPSPESGTAESNGEEEA